MLSLKRTKQDINKWHRGTETSALNKTRDAATCKEGQKQIKRYTIVYNEHITID